MSSWTEAYLDVGYRARRFAAFLAYHHATRNVCGYAHWRREGHSLFSPEVDLAVARMQLDCALARYRIQRAKALV